jgi:hypothetical protein
VRHTRQIKARGREVAMATKLCLDGRRGLLQRAIGLLGFSAVLAAAGEARAAGAPKSVARYQDHPKDGKQCDGCSFWVAGDTPTAKGTCKIVQGEISPQGWCTFWAQKAA